jgi:hypothetical protein
VAAVVHVVLSNTASAAIDTTLQELMLPGGEKWSLWPGTRLGEILSDLSPINSYGGAPVSNTGYR